MTREELIRTVSKITELRSEVARLSGLQKELKQLEAQLDHLTGSPIPERAHGHNSIEERVGRFLEEHPDRDFSAEEVARELSIKIPTTRAAFSKLRKARRIGDSTRGRVRALGREDLQNSETRKGNLSEAA